MRGRGSESGAWDVREGGSGWDANRVERRGRARAGAGAEKGSGAVAETESEKADVELTCGTSEDVFTVERREGGDARAREEASAEADRAGGEGVDASELQVEEARGEVARAARRQSSFGGVQAENGESARCCASPFVYGDEIGSNDARW